MRNSINTHVWTTKSFNVSNFHRVVFSPDTLPRSATCQVKLETL
jgi:hypothetical protein